MMDVAAGWFLNGTWWGSTVALVILIQTEYTKMRIIGVASDIFIFNSCDVMIW